MSAPDRVYTEEEIVKLFGTAYDLPKEAGDPEIAPSRFLRQWYIVKKSNPDTPVALPRDMRLKKYIVYGQLESSSEGPSPISIVIRPEYCWVVDRTHERRGIWIEPSGQPTSAWYWLRDPHAEKQAPLHQDTRAKLGLFSNVIDALQEQGPDGTDLYYAPFHFKLTPKELHQRLSCSDDMEFQLHQMECTYAVFQEPFDYELFERKGGLAFCKQHIAGFAAGFDGSKLSKAIQSMKRKKRKGAKAWTPEQYKESARLAEERSQREPWGEPLSHAREIHPNWKIMEANLGQVEHSRPNKKKPRNTESHDSSDDEQRSKKKAKRADASSEVKVDPMAEDRYSDERMIQAVNQFHHLLTPAPSNETGKWDDVVEKKFRVKDALSAREMVTKMMESDDASIESKLLMVAAFRNVCLLEDRKDKEEDKERGIPLKLFEEIDGKFGIGMLDEWKRDAKKTLDRLALLKEDEHWYNDIASYHFLNEYIRFVRVCFIVSKKKSLDKLKKKYNVGWNETDYLEDIKTFEADHAHTSNLLRTASMLTQKHLASILSDLPKAPATAPAASPSAPVPAALPGAAAAPAPAAVATSAVPTPSVAQAETTEVEQNRTRERDETLAALDEVEKLLKFAEERKQKLLDSLAESNADIAASASPANAVIVPLPAGTVPPVEHQLVRKDADGNSSAQLGNVSSETGRQAQGYDETIRQGCVVQ